MRNSYYGVVPAGTTLPVFFDTKDVTDGASITMTGFTVGDIKVYKGTTGTTRGSTAGYALIDTDGIDINSITGTHGFSINTGDGTVSGYWEIGAYYHIVISTITVDGVTVSGTVAHFRIGPPENVAGYQPVDSVKQGGDSLRVPGVSGYPEVSVTHWRNAEVEIPRIAGVPVVDPGYVIGAALEEDSEVDTNWGSK